MARLTRITLKLPCRPSVPKTTAQLPLPFSTSPCFAVRTASPRTLRISLCSYVSRVNFLEYGSYRNAGTEGLAIMIDSRWNRPSPTYLPKESALVQSTWSLGATYMSPSIWFSLGAVHPSTSPGLSGFDCGTVTSYRPRQTPISARLILANIPSPSSSTGSFSNGGMATSRSVRRAWTAATNCIVETKANLVGASSLATTSSWFCSSGSMAISTFPPGSTSSSPSTAR